MKNQILYQKPLCWNSINETESAQEAKTISINNTKQEPVFLLKEQKIK